jgi:hypothetical protein
MDLPTVAGDSTASRTHAARSTAASGWNRLFPFPGTGTIPGDIRTRSAMMLKNPSRGPQSSDGLRIVQSRSLAATACSAFAFDDE